MIGFLCVCVYVCVGGVVLHEKIYVLKRQFR